MHVESVLFQNLNIYAVKGIFATMSNTMIAGIVISIVMILLLFYVPKPQKRKPNFAWSLLCVAMFTLGLNLTDRLLGYAGMYGVENVIGMYADEVHVNRYGKHIAVVHTRLFVLYLSIHTDNIFHAVHAGIAKLYVGKIQAQGKHGHAQQ